jgi:acyl-CoA thioester hydrolase
LPLGTIAIPEGAVISTMDYRVPFFDTDAMGIVHHANYVRYLEIARISWLEEHHQCYTTYIAQGIHLATTRVEVDYLKSTRFDDSIQIFTWLEWVSGASLHLGYQIRHDGECVTTATTTHAVVNDDGRVRRLPKDKFEHLRTLARGLSPKSS